MNNLRKDDDGCIWRLEERNYRALLVIDCSGFPYVDYLGLCTLKRVINSGINLKKLVDLHGYLR